MKNLFLVLMIISLLVCCAPTSEISQKAVETFIEDLKESDKETAGTDPLLYDDIVYRGNGEMVVYVSIFWFGGSGESLARHALFLFSHWVVVSKSKDVSLVIAYEDIDFIRVDKDGGKGLLSKDEKEKLARKIAKRRANERLLQPKGKKLSV